MSEPTANGRDDGRRVAQTAGDASLPRATFGAPACPAGVAALVRTASPVAATAA